MDFPFLIIWTSPCVDPESFARGGPILTMFFLDDEESAV